MNTARPAGKLLQEMNTARPAGKLFQEMNTARPAGKLLQEMNTARPAGKAASEDEFGEKIGKWTASGKVLVVTTQVPHEGSDMTIYRVGPHIKERYGVLKAFDMTYEAIVTETDVDSRTYARSLSE